MDKLLADLVESTTQGWAIDAVKLALYSLPPWVLPMLIFPPLIAWGGVGLWRMMRR